VKSKLEVWGKETPGTCRCISGACLPDAQRHCSWHAEPAQGRGGCPLARNALFDHVCAGCMSCSTSRDRYGRPWPSIMLCTTSPHGHAPRTWGFFWTIAALGPPIRRRSPLLETRSSLESDGHGRGLAGEVVSGHGNGHHCPKASRVRRRGQFDSAGLAHGA
jgi:hypothetical protein